MNLPTQPLRHFPSMISISIGNICMCAGYDYVSHIVERNIYFVFLAKFIACLHASAYPDRIGNFGGSIQKPSFEESDTEVPRSDKLIVEDIEAQILGVALTDKLENERDESSSLVDNCPVCLIDMGVDEAGRNQSSHISKTACDHRFHTGCLTQWLEEFLETTCPICRKVLVDYRETPSFRASGSHRDD